MISEPADDTVGFLIALFVSKTIKYAILLDFWLFIFKIGLQKVKCHKKSGKKIWIMYKNVISSHEKVKKVLRIVKK